MAADTPIERAAELIRQADAIVITAGAGMGVDSGLPDFRSNEGFWNAYPPFRHLGLEFSQIANPRWFRVDPGLAWGFYGHRLNLYRNTKPHAGFKVLFRWAQSCPRGFFVFTSNVDGHFQRAGFPEDRLVEIHGSIHRLQPLDHPDGRTWDAASTQVGVDEASMRAIGSLPVDPRTGGLARPNILMFGDSEWDPVVTEAQHGAFTQWLASLEGAKMVVIELGAGAAIPTVRYQSELLVESHGASLIRVNPHEANCPDGQISIFSGALAALIAIDRQRANVAV